MAGMAKTSVATKHKLAHSGRRQTIELIKDTHTEELVIALCGPIGSGHLEVSQKLSNILTDDFGYDVQIIKLSEFIKAVNAIDESSQYQRIKTLQDGGNKLREDFGNAYLAEKAIQQITYEREEHRGSGSDSEKSDKYTTRRVCYIVDSIKNKDEYTLLSLIYREMFYCFGVLAPLEERVNRLQGKGMDYSQIYSLIDRDSGEEVEHGQQVGDTFVKSDFFIRTANLNDEVLNALLRRYVHLIFGTQIVTPTPPETAMYQAWAAAANSGCLSRQVGAALTDNTGSLISIGWNDVPAFGGGLYQAKSESFLPNPEDKRCFKNGEKCYNDEEKLALGEELFRQLVKAELLKEEDAFVFESTIRNTKKIKGLIEFSRSIHAEMHAILSAAHSEGHRIHNSKLYVTTYPCHSCARHIVAAGISEVCYIEPYRKSLALKLHKDAVSEDEQAKNKVRILPYTGVSPSRYLDLFSMQIDSRKSKDGGKMIRRKPRESRPILEESIENFPTRESIVVRLVEAKEAEKNGESNTTSGGNDESA